MKKTLFTLSLFILTNIALAQDLTYTVLNTSIGLSTGAIDLSVSGGVAPFTFSWTGPSGFNANTEDISGLAYGNYTVTVTDKYCGIAIITILVDNDIASDINENTVHFVSVFPNPTNGQISLVSDKPLYGANFKLVNVAGQTIMEKKDIGGNTFVFDVSECAPGIYFVEINNSGSVSRTRFVKK